MNILWLSINQKIHKSIQLKGTFPYWYGRQQSIFDVRELEIPNVRYESMTKNWCKVCVSYFLKLPIYQCFNNDIVGQTLTTWHPRYRNIIHSKQGTGTSELTISLFFSENRQHFFSKICTGMRNNCFLCFLYKT